MLFQGRDAGIAALLSGKIAACCVGRRNNPRAAAAVSQILAGRGTLHLAAGVSATL